MTKFAAIAFAGMFAAMLAIPTRIAFAADAQKVGKADTKEAFALVVAAVNQEMRPGGRYEFVEGQNRTAVVQKLAEMRCSINSEA